MKPGTYKAKAVSGALGETSKGDPQVAVEFEVVEGEFAGQTITWFGYFTDRTTERTMQALRFAGWKTDDLSDLAGLGSTEVKIVCQNEEYQGKTSLKVQWVNKIGGLALKAPMDASKAKAFAQRMKGEAVASRSEMPAHADDEPF